MTRATKIPRVDVQKDVGSLLMLRSTVSPLFRKISHLDAHRVILDFSGVEFMSRSFADEYLSAKAASQKRIEERRVPVTVRRMLDLVSSRLASAPSHRAEIHDSFDQVRAI
jgi:hypothetical protein